MFAFREHENTEKTSLKKNLLQRRSTYIGQNFGQERKSFSLWSVVLLGRAMQLLP